MAEDHTAELLQKADALIRRTRVFVAGSATRSAPPAAVAPTEDDLPVLTEIVTDPEAALATAPSHTQQHLDALREELSLWLDQELPQAVLRVTDGLADQLVGELTEQAEKNLLPRLIARLEGSAAQPPAENASSRAERCRQTPDAS